MKIYHSILFKILSIAFVGSLGFMINLGFSYFSADKNATLLDNLKHYDFPALWSAEQAINYLSRSKDALNDYVITGEDEGLEKARQYHDLAVSNLNEIIALPVAIAEQVKPILNNYQSYFEQASEIARKMANGEDITALLSKAQQTNQQYESTLEQLKSIRDGARSHFDDSIDLVNQLASDNILYGFIFGIIMIVVLFGTGFSISLNTRKNIRDVSNSMKNIAEDNGDLTLRIPVNTRDEVGELVKWFNLFIEKLQTTLTEVINTSEPLNQLANDLNNMTNTAKMRADQQSEAIRNNLNSVDAINQSVQQIAASASQAAEATRKADDEAHQGHRVVSLVGQSIDQLSTQVGSAAQVIDKLEKDTSNVGMVLDVIKSIAEQTNLLALNAAIEAARAGEQGRGFAVVADEVRSLASKTQDSTIEIEKLIENLQQAAQDAASVMTKGTGLAGESVSQAAQAGEHLRAITDTVTGINTMNESIASATEEQTRLAELILSTTQDINQRIQVATEESDQLSVMGQQLTRQSGLIEEITSHFKT